MLAFIVAIAFVHFLPKVPAKPTDVCPLVVEVSSTGAVFTNRFHGRNRTSLKLLASDLRGGCYNDANPSPVTSVTLQISPLAPKAIARAVSNTLEQNGWPPDKITVKAPITR